MSEKLRRDWNGTHQHLVYADNVNLLGKNIYTIHKNNEAIKHTTEEAGLEENIKKL
jgi:hypothetical protein